MIGCHNRPHLFNGLAFQTGYLYLGNTQLPGTLLLGLAAEISKQYNPSFLFSQPLHGFLQGDRFQNFVLNSIIPQHMLQCHPIIAYLSLQGICGHQSMLTGGDFFR